MHTGTAVVVRWQVLDGGMHIITIIVHGTFATCGAAYTLVTVQRSVLDSISRTNGELPCLCPLCLPHTQLFAFLASPPLLHHRLAASLRLATLPHAFLFYFVCVEHAHAFAGACARTKHMLVEALARSACMW